MLESSDDSDKEDEDEEEELADTETGIYSLQPIGQDPTRSSSSQGRAISRKSGCNHSDTSGINQNRAKSRHTGAAAGASGTNTKNLKNQLPAVIESDHGESSKRLLYRAQLAFGLVAQSHPIRQVGKLQTDLPDHQRYFDHKETGVRTQHEIRRICQIGNCLEKKKQVSTFCHGCSSTIDSGTLGKKIAKKLQHMCYDCYGAHIADLCYKTLEINILPTYNVSQKF